MYCTSGRSHLDKISDYRAIATKILLFIRANKIASYSCITLFYVFSPIETRNNEFVNIKKVEITENNFAMIYFRLIILIFIIIFFNLFFIINR